jgi:NADH-quinone oxidoreductase subunit L
MLILVLADNLLLLYLGWEGVGVCSYLLIGFWYKEARNGRAALKAFLVTRVGDTALLIGFLMLLSSFNTLRIQPLMQQISGYPTGSFLCTCAALLFLIGAMGKSAQVPLQTWLPDAMAGPTPVSALIHAATMVTAGVYLIARTHVLFSQAPIVQMIVAIIGAVTLLLAGFSALTQYDIKRVLAYSTISQIGYMFLALGVGAWAAAIFHFMVHAFFKSLLFLAAGVVINALGKEHNIFKMGGLRTQLPLTFWVFVAGCASLSAVPLITAGFYSKDMILWQVWASPEGSRWLWAAGLTGAFLTSMYSFRMLFIAFFGQAKAIVERPPGYLMSVPLLILAILSIIGGMVEVPGTLISNKTFTNFLHTALPPMTALSTGAHVESILRVVAGLVSLSGILAAYWLFLKSPRYVDHMVRSTVGSRVHQLWFADWGFDWLYDKLVVQPYVWLARINKDDFFDLFFDGVAWTAAAFNRVLSPTESGNVRWYAACIVIGAIIVLAFTVFS